MARKTGPVVQRKDATNELAQTAEIYATIRTGLRWAGAAACIFVSSYVIEPLAGENTALSIAVSLLADIKFAVAVSLAGGAVAWAAVERALRHRKTENLQGRIRELETYIDPDRSTSGLTPKGKTNPKDKVR